MKIFMTIISPLLMLSSAYGQEGKKPTKHKLYQSCLEQADHSPKKALITAKKWQVSGGNTAARHCTAVALFNLQNFKEAGSAFERLSEEVDFGFFEKGFSEKYRDHLKAELLYQAGLSWVGASNLGRAYILLSLALTQTPKNSELSRRIYVERGLLQESRRKYDEALKDLTVAIDYDAGIAEVYIYRAHVFRVKKNYKYALQDIDRALYILPDNLDALLESGIIYRLMGESKKAKMRWEKIIKLNPKSQMAKIAQENIKLLKN